MVGKKLAPVVTAAFAEWVALTDAFGLPTWARVWVGIGGVVAYFWNAK